MNIFTEPSAAAGTIAAFATIAPWNEFNVDASGCDWSAGQMVRNCRIPRGTAVTFTEYALALAGTPQLLCGIANVRVPPL